MTDVLNDAVLDYGDEAVATLRSALGGGTRGKSVAKKPTKGDTIIIVSGGYTRYASTADEVTALRGKTWQPQTADFVRTATDAGHKRFSAVDEGTFLGALAQYPRDLARVVFLGHGYTGGLQLTDAGSVLDSSSLSRPGWRSAVSKIAAKFTKDASFDLIACNVAVRKAFTETLSSEFQVRVRAFKTDVAWCVEYDRSTVSIISRGAIALARDVRLQAKKQGVSTIPCKATPWARGVDAIMKHKSVRLVDERVVGP